MLLKNERGTLPIKSRAGVYVAGSNADNIGNQAGGWTLTWQGGSTNMIPGTTILDGIRSAAGKTSRHVQRDGIGADQAWLGRRRRRRRDAVRRGLRRRRRPAMGLRPGDGGVLRPVKDMKLSAADSAAVDKVCAATPKCVVVVVSGRPMVLDPQQLRQVDALVAAWLPGSEGAGVADPLFGKARYTGKLPMTWPRTLEQEPINVGDAHYDPLYRYGHGLRTR